MSPRFVVHGLTTGEQYIFRVKAVNAVGTSENSQESEVIKVQAALSTYPTGSFVSVQGYNLCMNKYLPHHLDYGQGTRVVWMELGNIAYTSQWAVCLSRKWQCEGKWY